MTYSQFEKPDYSGFVPECSTDPNLLKPYTDALASDYIDHLFESMDTTVYKHTVCFESKTRFGTQVGFFGPESSVSHTKPIDFTANGSFTTNEVDLKLRTLQNDTPRTLRVRKGTSDDSYSVFTDDSFDVRSLDDDAMVDLCLRIADSDPLTRHAVVLQEADSHVAKSTFPLILASFWQGLAMRREGLLTSSRYLEMPLPNSSGLTTYVRLLQDDIEKPKEMRQRLVIEHATIFEDLDAEQVTRLELQYISTDEKLQKNSVHRFTASGVSFEKAYLRITKQELDGTAKTLDPTDPSYLIQFQALLHYMIESATN